MKLPRDIGGGDLAKLLARYGVKGDVSIFLRIGLKNKGTVSVFPDRIFYQEDEEESDFMETLKMERPKEVIWDYDKDADTLYISFGTPQEALTMDLGAGILARYLEKSGKLVGFTIVGVSGVLGLEHHRAA